MSDSPEPIEPLKVTPIFASIRDAAQIIVGGGCGAYVGSKGCSAPATSIAVGELELYFSTYRSLIEPLTLTTYCALCDAHNSWEDGRLIADASPRVLRDARVELAKAFKDHGRELPVPNMLDPRGEHTSAKKAKD